MQKTTQISDVWLKAAILGSTWAVSEIILGSFLNNLRVPFNGNILTTIGLMLMIAASYKWKDSGLFWRTGLICALMKTLSPSAIIFGPMIAIFMEALLLDLSVRVLGRNIFGYIVGSILAMSWILAQKIINMVLFYGNNIIAVYTELMKFAERQLKTNFDLVVLPLFILLGIYMVFGLISAYFGVKIGRRLLDVSTLKIENSAALNFDFFPKKTDNFPYKIQWLVFNFVVLIGVLLVINFTAIYIWVFSTLAALTIWIIRYKRALKQLSKPKFWGFFILITLLTAFLITGVQNEQNRWISGLIIGLQMNFRAAVVIVGFSVIGQELYNPQIRNYFAKTGFKQLPIALEIAFDSLPDLIKNLPDIKSVFKNPVGIVQTMVHQAEQKFNTMKDGKTT